MTMGRSSGQKNDKERSEHFGDHDFKGLGTIMCKACGEPTRDHQGFGPCPKLGLSPGERMVGISMQAAVQLKKGRTN